MCRPRETRFASAQGGGFRYMSDEILLFSYPGGWMLATGGRAVPQLTGPEFATRVLKY